MKAIFANRSSPMALDHVGRSVAATFHGARAHGDEDATNLLFGPRILRLRVDQLGTPAGSGAGMLGRFRLPKGVRLRARWRRGRRWPRRYLHIAPVPEQFGLRLRLHVSSVGR